MKTQSIGLFAQRNWLTFNNRCKNNTTVLIYKCLIFFTAKYAYIADIISFSKNSKYGLCSAALHDITNSGYKAAYWKKSYRSMDQNILMPINKCALNFLLFLVACFTEDQQIWYHTLVQSM